MHITQNHKNITSKFSFNQRAVPDSSSFLIKYIVLSQANLSKNMIKTLFTSNIVFLAILAIGIIFLLVGLTAKKTNDPVEKTKSIANFYDLKATSIEGKQINFSQFKGKKVLIVNTASSCGYTYQYEGLQKLHDIYGDDVAILGFPANDFLYQERGSDADIADFCEKNYGVTFQLFSKITTRGKNQSSVYKWLTDKNLNGWNEKKPTWNFCKYLVNEEGDLVAFFDKSVKPLSKEITGLL
jgi:glutathione peroxidase